MIKKEDIFIYKSNGFYFGFIRNDYLFSRDGIYLGWIEGKIVWDAGGRFRGVLVDYGNDHFYILSNRFAMPPAARTPKATSSNVVPPAPRSNIAPISLPVELSDSFI
jgi:hypothetical protein